MNSNKSIIADSSTCIGMVSQLSHIGVLASSFSLSRWNVSPSPDAQIRAAPTRKISFNEQMSFFGYPTTHWARGRGFLFTFFFFIERFKRGAPSCLFRLPGALPEKWQWQFDRHSVGKFDHKVEMVLQSSGEGRMGEELKGWWLLV